MKKIIAGVLATGAIAATSAPASATVVLPAGTLDPLACNATFTECGAAFNYGPLSFVDDFTKSVTFTLPMLGTIGSGVTTEFSAETQDIDFTSITIDGVHAFTQTGFDPNAETWSILGLTGLSAGPHTIEFAGTSAGQGFFGGTFSFAAVPEPTTWLMMILGFAVVGGAMRRRQDQPRVRYTLA